ncbi:polyamine aminopropyltransferase [Falsiroseomonas tokyonensis]|uniref:Spermidine synthase n=1 Tax=Falsiroseomonas tokyonensis TaxID=430521 RepID=A0ABV7C4T5_9PROT|nr:spermidine synthase [Falsiroseomonas tokyonensis]MBU8541646.1 spermidine synthase [Falsiroseomonas tokyonensis]
MRFKELDFRPTPLGILSLRCRRPPDQHQDIYEIKLNDDFLMSSQFTYAEIALARLGLAALYGAGLDVVVGGLGLGHTAAAVLEDLRVRSLRVVEALPDVIGWHKAGLLPLGAGLIADPRCELVHGDFFAFCAAPDQRFASGMQSEKAHAILVDIDHSPSRLLHPSHAPFYEPDGLRGVLGHLYPGGIFALWSDDPPDPGFVATLTMIFADVETHVVRFDSLHGDHEVSNTIYVARRSSELT